MTSPELLSAQDKIASLLQPDEKIDSIDIFQYKSEQDRIRTAVISVVAGVMVVAAAVFIVPQFPALNSDGDLVGRLVFIAVLTVGLLLMSFLMSPLQILAITNKRLIVTPLPTGQKTKGEPYVWTLFGDDITRVERMTSSSGAKEIKLWLTRNRKTMGYMATLDVKELPPLRFDELSGKLEKFRESNRGTSGDA